jgi:hypothetical protein
MSRPGPQLEVLLRRLQDMPSEFLLEQPGQSFGAVVHDLMVMLFDDVDPDALQRCADTHRRNVNPSASCSMLVAWLLADPWFTSNPQAMQQPHVWTALTSMSTVLAEEASVSAWRTDAVRREELVRSLLATVDLRPSAETEAQAQDRLVAISSSQRRRVVAAAQEAERRAAEIREALARQAAQEAADKSSRE